MAKRTATKKTAAGRSAIKRTSAKRAAPGSSRKGASPARAAATSAPKRPRAKAATKRVAGARGSGAVPRGAERRQRAAKPNRPRQASSPVATAVRGAVATAIAAVSDRLPWTADSTDAITLLEADHRRMEALLKQGEQTTARGAKKRTELLNTLTRELKAHELIEEQVLYPALQSHPEARDIVLEGYEEHHVADLIVEELHAVARDDEQWGAKFKVLKENIEHHIQEEEGDMFRTARGLFSAEQLQQLGATMARLKAESPGGGKA